MAKVTLLEAVNKFQHALLLQSSAISMTSKLSPSSHNNNDEYILNITYGNVKLEGVLYSTMPSGEGYPYYVCLDDKATYLNEIDCHIDCNKQFKTNGKRVFKSLQLLQTSREAEPIAHDMHKFFKGHPKFGSMSVDEYPFNIRDNLIDVELTLHITPLQMLYLKHVLPAIQGMDARMLASVFKDKLAVMMTSNSKYEREIAKAINADKKDLIKDHTKQNYTNPTYVQFCNEVESASMQVEHYQGRDNYSGPAVRAKDVQDVIRKTTVKVRWELLGDEFIVYPTSNKGM